MSTPEERRAARAAWPIRVVRLGEEPLVDPRDPTTVDERIALVGKLTLEAWAFQGRAISDYPRSEMPGVVLRKR